MAYSLKVNKNIYSNFHPIKTRWEEGYTIGCQVSCGLHGWHRSCACHELSGPLQFFLILFLSIIKLMSYHIDHKEALELKSLPLKWNSSLWSQALGCQSQLFGSTDLGSLGCRDQSPRFLARATAAQVMDPKKSRMPESRSWMSISNILQYRSMNSWPQESSL